MKKLSSLLLLLTLLLSPLSKAEAFVAQYYCTASCAYYYPHLLNLIGSLHETNFTQIGEIAVFDLGMRQEQIDHLNTIQKVKVYKIKENNPDLLTYFSIPNGRQIPGWYMWKPVAIKEALEMFPWVLWIDAGTTVLRPLDSLFYYIREQGYFLATIGDETANDQFIHSIGWQSTSILVDHFGLNLPENRWILSQEPVMGGFVGVSRTGFHFFAKDWYEYTHDTRFFADDGTTPSGYGTGRHDQAVLSIMAYLRGLKIHVQSHLQEFPIILETIEGDFPFYITWVDRCVDHNTCIWNSRGWLNRDPLLSPNSL